MKYCKDELIFPQGERDESNWHTPFVWLSLLVPPVLSLSSIHTWVCYKDQGEMVGRARVRMNKSIVWIEALMDGRVTNGFSSANNAPRKYSR